MRLRLYKCQPSDLVQLSVISRKTFREAFEADNDPEDFKAYMDFAFNKTKLLSEIKNPHTDFYFVFLYDDLVGYFKLNKQDAQTDLKLDKSMELERIYVDNEYQGIGIGKWILDEVKRIAFELQKQFLWLGVWEKNTKAIEFYHQQGFIKFGTHPYYIGMDKQTDWLMRYDLVNFK